MIPGVADPVVPDAGPNVRAVVTAPKEAVGEVENSGIKARLASEMASKSRTGAMRETIGNTERSILDDLKTGDGGWANSQ